VSERIYWIDADSRQAIYDRDGWICQLCFESVDRALSPNDKYAATLDHIEPRLFGGTDEAENLRLAHRYCNSKRGADKYIVKEATTT
jgi:5-methylcytosine-specific restriction endonuclease McrA